MVGYVVSALNGQKYGLIGGRSLGMYSAVVSMGVYGNDTFDPKFLGGDEDE